MTTEYISRGKRGGAVTLLGQAGKALVQFASVVILSRLLSPEEFGLVAIVMAIVLLADLFRDAGLTMATLRATDLTHQQASNVFWVNTALGTLIAFVVAVSAPVLLHIYGDPRLLLLAPLLASTLVLTGLQAQLNVHLARMQRYTALAATEVASQAFGLVAAVVTALAGWGVWALAAQLIVASATLVLMRWVSSGWVPSRPRRGSGSMGLIKSGVDYAASQVLAYIASNIDTLVIGARWGATSLGYYNRAFQLLSVPLGRALTPLNNIAVPTLNRLRSQGQDIEGYLIKLQALIGIPTVALFAIAGGAASALVPLVLGAGWEKTVVLFQVLAVAGALRALDHVSYWAYLSLVTSRQYLMSIVVTKLLTIVMIIGAAQISVIATAWAYAGSVLMTWLVNLTWLRITARLSWTRFFWHGTRQLAVGAFSAAAAGGVSHVLADFSNLISFVMAGLAGATMFVGLALILPGMRTDLSIILKTFR